MMVAKGIGGGFPLGAVLATEGSTRLFGYVTAAVLDQRGEDDNTLGGSTVVDLTHSSEDYNPTVIPNMDPDTGEGGSGGGSGGPDEDRVKLMWSRYL